MRKQKLQASYGNGTERRFEPLKNVLLLYALLHQYIQFIIEGDELYTRVGKNVSLDQLGWTVVIMDRAMRFLWELQCGSKTRKLFRRALRALRALKKGVRVRSKNKGSQARKRGRKRKKYQSPWTEHPDTTQKVDEKEIHANHCEAFNAALRRRNSAFRRRSNTYAKDKSALQRTLNIYWVVHNFVHVHFTTKKVPAVALGLIDRALSWDNLFMIHMVA